MKKSSELSLYDEYLAFLHNRMPKLGFKVIQKTEPAKKRLKNAEKLSLAYGVVLKTKPPFKKLIQNKKEFFLVVYLLTLYGRKKTKQKMPKVI